MYEFKVSGMTCQSCARTMRSALLTIDPKLELEVNLPGQFVRVKSERSEQEIAALIEDTGYPVLKIQKINQET